MKEPGEIQKQLKEHFPEAIVEVLDTTGTKDHFRVTVASDAFRGKSRVESHRMVYSPFRDDIGGAIHAFSIKTLTKEEWAKQKENQIQ